MSTKLHPRLIAYWKDDPSDPDRPKLDNLEVQQLIDRVAPGSPAIDLGGTMSLNVRLELAGLVVRVHQPFVTRQRLLAVQRVRQALMERGCTVPMALDWQNTTVIRCGRRWAELERYIPHRRVEATLNSSCWLFRALGKLHYELATLEITVPRPLIATYAPPGSLHRWLAVTQSVVQSAPEAVEMVQLLQKLVRQVQKTWVAASRLPQQLVHGDVCLSNVCQTLDGRTLYLDFGFLAWRPRIHDLAYSLAFLVLAIQWDQPPENFAWQSVEQLIEVYEAEASSQLSIIERKALVPYAATVLLHSAALDGFGHDPARQLKSRLPFLRLSEWLLNHPEVGQR